MYDQMKDSMKPMMDMAEINKKTAEKLISLQSQYVSDFVSSSLSQMKALTEVKDPKAAIEAQIRYMKEIEAKASDIAQQEISALSEAKAQLTLLMEKTLEELGDKDYLAEVQKVMQGFAKK
ncbi:MAG: phasin family protein [Nitrincola lacisaponensis]|uniref:Phasin domain-containing protein n=1 Tax=Nitrincola lacisaponensis TaxID=267850 RepID=A0A063Y3T6_9GAMM|nr:phasin family protein [Nitrincola lacisaponensis]KDE39416.1 hypothetical protein ADINL_2545 [Nitrincola lacisaponensis]